MGSPETTLIENGLLVTAEGSWVADLYVADGRIAAIGKLDVRPDRIIDAAGKYVLPGCVDVHTHMDLPLVGNFDPDSEAGDDWEGRMTADDFTTGTIAAACGGTTTIVDFAEQAPGQGLLDGVETWHRKLDRAKPLTDVGFHLIVRELGASARDDIRELKRSGVTSLKLFMAYKGDLMVNDAVLWAAMKAGAAEDVMAMVHAENGDVIDALIQAARDAGQLAPRYHGSTRPAITESEAVGRAIDIARLAGCALYVVHVSAAETASRIAQARRRGDRIWAETCAQYLVCDGSDLSRPGFEGAKYVFTPPPRRGADRSRLWWALEHDVLSVVSSDHSPAPFEGGKTLGRDDFAKIPNGAGGVEERLMVVHDRGVNSGRISLNRMVELLATNPAKLFGLHPQKGSLSVGADADIVIFDPEAERRLSAEELRSNCDYSLYEGMVVRGAPELVMLRGTVVVAGGRPATDRGVGRFVTRRPVTRMADTRVAV